jgi:DNA/RNA endonuclease G (NUC1)
MAPAADFICHPDMRDATFTMANVCPQVRYVHTVGHLLCVRM